MLDIGGTASSRRAELTKLGTDIAHEVKQNGESSCWPDDPARTQDRSRRGAAAGLRSESGREPDRYVVVYPA